ncbi:hypothetical protein EYC80_002761 [Monilinia laxa]|uniref:Uncharacterized protein n=1 Tax=Monilinia laxa TaxID=61186 RepID=A0A5N6KBK6_MONLA|nr:hypothetical protein EYC80_002761 [Monilinia laxa]
MLQSFSPIDELLESCRVTMKVEDTSHKFGTTVERWLEMVDKTLDFSYDVVQLLSLADADWRIDDDTL